MRFAQQSLSARVHVGVRSEIHKSKGGTKRDKYQEGLRKRGLEKIKDG